jgi:LmbE family N-acetylglucosaminyl deacetylase
MLRAALGADATAPLRLLCLGAHADDIEIGCGGTILRLLAERSRVCVRWIVFSGDRVRQQEAQDSARAFLAGAAGAEIVVRDFRESYFPGEVSAIKDYFETLKRAEAPDVVFTHRRDDVHQDHRTVAELTWNTFRDHLVLEYEIPKYEGDLGHPNVFVPLSEAAARRKVDLLLRHFPSQHARSWFRAQTFEAVLRLRAIECNAPDGFAEGLYGRKIAL